MTKEQAIEKLISKEQVIYGRKACLRGETSLAQDGMMPCELSRSKVVDVKKLAALLAKRLEFTAEELLELS